MKTKIQIAILWLFGWRKWDTSKYSVTLLKKYGETINSRFVKECKFKLFYVHEAWERQFKNK